MEEVFNTIYLHPLKLLFRAYKVKCKAMAKLKPPACPPRKIWVPSTKSMTIINNLLVNFSKDFMMYDAIYDQPEDASEAQLKQAYYSVAEEIETAKLLASMANVLVRRYFAAVYTRYGVDADDWIVCRKQGYLWLAVLAYSIVLKVHFDCDLQDQNGHICRSFNFSLAEFNQLEGRFLSTIEWGLNFNPKEIYLLTRCASAKPNAAVAIHGPKPKA